MQHCLDITYSESANSRITNIRSCYNTRISLIVITFPKQVRRCDRVAHNVFDLSQLLFLGQDWIELDWIGLDWIAVDWTGLGWTKLEWIGLDRIGLDWTRLDFMVIAHACTMARFS